MKTYEKPTIESIELREMQSVMLSMSNSAADDSKVFANPFRGFGGNPFEGNPFANPFDSNKLP